MALLLPNGLEAVACYLACFRMRLVIVPLDSQYHPLQIGYALGHSGAAILIASHARMAGLEEAGVLGSVPRVAVVGGGPTTGSHRPFESLLGAERAVAAELPHDDTPAVMIYTSGTTSRPKGVVLSHGALATGIRKYLTRVTLTPAGLGLLMATPDFHACDFSHLRFCLSGGDRLATRLLESFERLTGVAVTEQCGSTETGPYAMNPPFGRKKPGSIGPPVHGVQVAVVDEHGADVPAGTVGDVRVSGPGIMEGYWNETALTRKTLQKGWVLTGDLARFDEDGYLWFVGRRKDVIVRMTNGLANKIAPLEVETALAEHPAVREACVIGVPDAACGETPRAYVILQPGAEARAEDLRSFVAGRLAEFMVPAEVHLISEMPSKGPGKIDRELLRMRAITAALIEQVPFFKNASGDFLRDIIPRLDARHVAPGETIVHEGNVGDEMYFLTKGQVEVSRGDPPQRLTILREGSFFGELAILKDAPRAATIRALTDVEVYALRRDAVLALARAHADFGRYLQAGQDGDGR